MICITVKIAELILTNRRKATKPTIFGISPLRWFIFVPTAKALTFTKRAQPIADVAEADFPKGRQSIAAIPVKLRVNGFGDGSLKTDIRIC